ncbi:MAG TPA: ornithine cyclodeaminase family protein [Gemmatimonadaceae bacterium]|nr:ornithine cyclodeaminase family protein [Gemmatimonadaceae bacterium]
MHDAAILLSASDVERYLDHRELLTQLHAAMCAYATSNIEGRRTHSPIPSASPHSVMIVFPGLVPGIPAYTVKVNAKLPASTPAVRGLIALHDLESGRLLAVMDSIKITEVRTALTGALATHALAKRRVARVAVIGAGVQGRAQLRALRLVRDIDSATVFDLRRERADAFAETMGEELQNEITVEASVERAVADADVVIVATWATTPILSSRMIAPGTHITSVGADEPGKAELTADLISRSYFVCDDEELALEMGALAGVGLGREAIGATLGEVLSGAKRGRMSDDQVTLFGSVGLPCQDLPAAWMVYQKARQAESATFDFHT